MIRLGWHVLASRRGYTTEGCSTDVSSEEISALETLGFGQTNDAGYLSSLDTEPAVLGRPLPGGRYAITRCLEGELDSAGRKTLRFVSMIYEREDWLRIGGGSVASLADQRSLWNRRLTSGTPIKAKPNPTNLERLDRPALMGIVSALLERRDHEVLRVPDDAAFRQLLMALPAVLPDKQRCEVRWGVRLLSQGSGIYVGTFDIAADSTGRRRVLEWRENRVSHPYARALQDIWDESGTFPEEFRAGCGDATRLHLRPESREDRADRHTHVEPMIPVRRSRMRLKRHALILVGILALTLSGLAIGLAVSGGRERSKSQEALPDLARAERDPSVALLLQEYEDRGHWNEASLRDWITRAGRGDAGSELSQDATFSAARGSCVKAVRWIEDKDAWLTETSGLYEACNATSVPENGEGLARMGRNGALGWALATDPRVEEFPGLERGELDNRITCLTKIAADVVRQTLNLFASRYPALEPRNRGPGLWQRVPGLLPRALALPVDWSCWEYWRQCEQLELRPPPLAQFARDVTTRVAWAYDALSSTPSVAPDTVPPVTSLELNGAQTNAQAYLRNSVAEEFDLTETLRVYELIRGDEEYVRNRDVLRSALKRWFETTAERVHNEIAANERSLSDGADEGSLSSTQRFLTEVRGGPVTTLGTLHDAGIGSDTVMRELEARLEELERRLDEAMRQRNEESPDGDS